MNPTVRDDMRARREKAKRPGRQKYSCYRDQKREWEDHLWRAPRRLPPLGRGWSRKDGAFDPLEGL